MSSSCRSRPATTSIRHRSATPTKGLDHFWLTVSGIDALDADLKAKGVEFTMEPNTHHPARPAHLLLFARSARYLDQELLERDQKYA